MSMTFDNVNQVHARLRAEGWKCSYNKVAADIRRGRLRPRRGGGFAPAAVTAYARSFLARAVDEDQALDAPDLPPAERTEEPTGAGVRRQEADAELKSAQAELAKLKLERERRGLLPRELYEKDLAARMALFSTALDAHLTSLAGPVAGLFGGDVARAEAIIDLVDGDPNKVMDLVGWMQKIVPEVAALLLSKKQDWLAAFAREAVQVVELENILAEGDDDAA